MWFNSPCFSVYSVFHCASRVSFLSFPKGEAPSSGVAGKALWTQSLLLRGCSIRRGKRVGISPTSGIRAKVQSLGGAVKARGSEMRACGARSTHGGGDEDADQLV